MAHQIRRTQHRPKEKDNKELAEVKRENMQLKRKIAKLQKQLEKFLHIVSEIPEEEKVPTPLEVERPDVSKCEACGGVSLKPVSLPIGILIVCGDCGKRTINKKVDK